jgi:hypothetical protein
VLANWTQKAQVYTMIPGLKKVNMKPITIIFDTERRIEYSLADVVEWNQIESYEVEKNREESRPIVKNSIKEDELKFELPDNNFSKSKMKENRKKLKKTIE